MKIEAILVHSERPGELVDFYRAAFDLPGPTPAVDPHVGWPAVTPYFGVDDDPYSTVSIWFRVDDVQEAIDRLLALGATELTSATAEESPGEVIGRVRDPAGNVVGLVADLPG